MKWFFVFLSLIYLIGQTFITNIIFYIENCENYLLSIKQLKSDTKLIHVIIMWRGRGIDINKIETNCKQV